MERATGKRVNGRSKSAANGYAWLDVCGQGHATCISLGARVLNATCSEGGLIPPRDANYSIDIGTEKMEICAIARTPIIGPCESSREESLSPNST